MRLAIEISKQGMKDSEENLLPEPRYYAQALETFHFDIVFQLLHGSHWIVEINRS